MTKIKHFEQFYKILPVRRQHPPISTADTADRFWKARVHNASAGMCSYTYWLHHCHRFSYDPVQTFFGYLGF